MKSKVKEVDVMIIAKIIGLILLIAIGVVLLFVGGVVATIIAVFGEISIWIFRLVLGVLIISMLFKMVKDLF